MIDPRDPIRALTLLTRIPVPGADGARAAEAAWAWPLIGALVGGIQIFVGMGALALNLPVSVAAGLAVAVGIIVTGALHEDGLADCADGFWGGHDRSRRLEILKDSRIGAYGVLALGLAVGLRWALFAALLPEHPLALIAAGLLSRAAMAGVMGWLPFARASGLAAHVGRPSVAAVALGSGIALVGGIVATGVSAIVAVLGVLAVSLIWGALARAKIGGQTGDVLGATQVLGELVALMICAALMLP